VAAGDAAAEWLGRRVVVPRLLPCGDCARCRRGLPTRCTGRAPRAGLATHEIVPARFLCALDGSPPLWPADWAPDDLWRAAALADAASAPYAALSRAGLGPGEQLVVIGGGPRAILACAIARAKGAHPSAVAEATHAELLRAAGAESVHDSALAPSQITVAADVILETTGSAAGRHRALALLPPGGCAVFLDGPDGLAAAVPVPPPDWRRFAADECRLYGAEAAHPDLLPELCALFARGELPLASLVSAVEPSQLLSALARMREGQLTGLPIVRFR